MKKTISFIMKGKALLCGLVLTGGLLLVSAVSASAQQSANGTVNPYTHIAEKLSVTAYPLGSFERTHTMDVLENILEGLKQVIGSGGGTNSQKMKYDFCNAVLADINTHYIAVEITLLTSLSELNAQKSTVGIDAAQLRQLYNQIVSQLQ